MNVEFATYLTINLFNILSVNINIAPSSSSLFCRDSMRNLFAEDFVSEQIYFKIYFNILYFTSIWRREFLLLQDIYYYIATK